MSRAQNDKTRYRPPGTIAIGSKENQKISSTTNSKASDQKHTGMKKEEKAQSRRSELAPSDKSQMTGDSQYKKELEEAKEREKALVIQVDELKKLTEALQKQIKEKDDRLMELEYRRSPSISRPRRSPSNQSSGSSGQASQSSRSPRSPRTRRRDRRRERRAARERSLSL